MYVCFSISLQRSQLYARMRHIKVVEQEAQRAAGIQQA